MSWGWGVYDFRTVDGMWCRVVQGSADGVVGKAVHILSKGTENRSCYRIGQGGVQGIKYAYQQVATFYCMSVPAESCFLTCSRAHLAVSVVRGENSRFVRTSLMNSDIHCF